MTKIRPETADLLTDEWEEEKLFVFQRDRVQKLKKKSRQRRGRGLESCQISPFFFSMTSVVHLRSLLLRHRAFEVNFYVRSLKYEGKDTHKPQCPKTRRGYEYEYILGHSPSDSRTRYSVQISLEI